MGRGRQLTQAYAQIAESLQEIGNAGVAHIPLEAVQDHSDGPPSIMNVTMLDQIGGDSAMIKIRGVKDGKLGEPVAIRRSHLAALTTELVFRWRIHGKSAWRLWICWIFRATVAATTRPG